MKRILDVKDREDLRLKETVDVLLNGMMALLTVCEGSKQILTLSGLLAVAGRSRTTILDINGSVD